MGKVYDTSGKVDTYYLLTQTPKNFVKDNYYLRELQEKVWADWEHRPNRVDIEQETGIGTEEYFPLEVVIQSVRSDSGEKVSDDWRRIVFKDIFEHRRIGTRYRFSYKFDLEEPDELKSIWLAVNQDSASPTAQQVIVRCNGTLGSIWVDEEGNKVYHYEPVVQVTELRSASAMFNEVAIDPRGQLTIIAQHNKFTRDYYINQRFVIGYDQIYKITNIIKTDSLTTYNPNDVGIMTIYLDYDQKGTLDDFVNRIAYNGRVEDETVQPPSPIVNDYQLRIIKPSPIPYILGTEDVVFEAYVFNGEEKTDKKISVRTELQDTQYPERYYSIEYVDGNAGACNQFVLHRKTRYQKGKLIVTCNYTLTAEDSPTEEGKDITQSFELSLWGD